MSKRTVPKIFYLILVLIPIMFFVLLELGLRFFDYGYNYDLWVQVDKDRVGLNPEAARRYFYTTKQVPESIKDVFLKEKPENGYRIFVLGGSSAAGYPYVPNGSFSRYIRDRLKILLPKREIEVVNLSLTAVNSYTVRDFFEGLLDYEPNAVLIYAGHNEYYGALGVGSLESLGQSRFFVNLVLSLNQFKTVQLVRDIVSNLMSASSSQSGSRGTLMSRMAEDQSIELGSEIYEAGIDQFRENITDVLKSANENNIPIYIATLTSNLSDQPPFVSKKTTSNPSANQVYKNAQQAISEGDFQKADSLFRYAKDLDMLRFRAPEKINETIQWLAENYKVKLVNVDSVFAGLSPKGITGSNLMTDHLHPTLNGYFEIGKAFVDKMYKSNQLPLKNIDGAAYVKSDSITRANFHFTKLDSTIADFRLILLKNDWPYIDPRNSKPPLQIIPRNNVIDSLAFKVVVEDYSWEQAQRDLANWYLAKNEFDKYISQMDNLINQFPYFEAYYDLIADELLKRHNYNSAYNYLLERYKIMPSDFSTKWLGIISLSRNRINDAEKYLLESVNLNDSDPQVFYNLAGVYIKKQSFSKAKEFIDQCLYLDPQFKGAQNLKNQLERVR